jgi:hypothetical protein
MIRIRGGFDKGEGTSLNVGLKHGVQKLHYSEEIFKFYP